MIFRFLVDPDAITHFGVDQSIGLFETKRLIEAWKQYGVLLIESGNSGKKFQTSIDNLPHDLRILWKEALEKLRQRDAPENWKGITEIEGSKDFLDLQTSANMACLGEFSWLISGFDPNKFSERMQTGIEAVKMSAIDISDTFRHSSKLAHQEIPLGTPTEEVWNSRFKESARHTKNVTLVDRYCIDELIRDRTSGLRKFLINCDRDASKLSVRVFSRFPADIDERMVEEKIQQSLPALARGGIKYLQIHLLWDDDMQRSAHGRYVRFRNDYLFSIDTGISVLKEQKVWANCAFNMMPADSQTTKKELTMAARARKVIRISA